MLRLEGKYNTADVMIDEVDETTREQIIGFLNHPAFAGEHIAIMPDCHAGKGAVIGFTMKRNQYIIPNIIGVDIGCGMLMACFGDIECDLSLLDAHIQREIPSGFNINRHPAGVDERLKREVRKVCRDITLDEHKTMCAIGSLGGGNHFIEAGRDDNGQFYVTIHSGSRNFGKCVADYYQQRARKECADNKEHSAELAWLRHDSPSGKAYLDALRVAQNFAAANRHEMMRRVCAHLGREPLELFESVHNFIGEDDIIRKGATPAHRGQKVIIPFNMRDGIALCEGKGAAAYNFSAPHGAGRILSRTQARKLLSVQSFVQQMRDAGVYTTTAGKGTLDEAPAAYKNTNLVLENIAGTVDVLRFIKPLYNFKAGAD